MSLLLRLCAGWLIDVIILSVWAAIDPFSINLQQIGEEVSKKDLHQLLKPFSDQECPTVFCTPLSTPFNDIFNRFMSTAMTSKNSYRFIDALLDIT